MEDDLIQQLRKLQIEENKILDQLAAIRRGKQELQVGDTVKLLTKGVRSTRGDLAVVTKVTGSSVHLRIKGTGHHTRRAPKNVQKVAGADHE